VDEAAKYRWLASHILPHEGTVRGWIARHVRTLAVTDADDLIQEAYARLWSSELPTVENARAYFFAVVRNLVLEHARRARIVPMERLGEWESLRIISEEPGPDRQVGARQELDRLRGLLRDLPPQCRRTFELRKFDGLSIRETATQMGITESTVEKHLSKALAMILASVGRADAELTSEGHAKRGDADGLNAPAANTHGQDADSD
jgi:RNA polymerase sigma factor (sigma-70 family)